VHTIERQAYAFSFFINETKLDQLLDELDEKVYKKPIDAKLNDKEEITSGKPGKALDRQAFNLAFRKFVYQGEPTEMELPVKRIYPRVDGELLSEISEQEIGSYVTYFKKNNKKRTHNIKLSTEGIVSDVVLLGETFSLNMIVGKRTEEKGYKRAPVIVKGELAEDIG